jgi:hypothetical protein
LGIGPKSAVPATVIITTHYMDEAEVLPTGLPSWIRKIIARSPDQLIDELVAPDLKGQKEKG